MKPFFKRVARLFKNKAGELSIARMLVAAALLCAVIPAGYAYLAPPAGFQTQLVVGDELEGPSGFEITPDGRIFVLERTGTVKVIKDGQLLPQPFAVMPSVASGDRGLIGVAFDPDFGRSNNWVYFYYTGEDLLNHLVRYDASGDTGTNGPFEIFTTQSPSQQLHVGGTIQFGPDGKMYFAVGDNGYPPNAQDLTNPHGKILRINKDGTIPADNPFYGESDKLGAIWAYGLRNPWRFQFDKQTGELYSADVGDYTWEEANKITKGGNYGWPVHEGLCQADCDGYINPFYTYNHNGESASITGGPVYRDDMFPAEYKGSYFFGDYAQGFIKRATFNSDGSVKDIIDFDTNAGSVVDMKIAPDGSMYYITYYPGRMYRVSYNTENPVPTANASADKTRGAEVPFTVNFSSAGSSDPDGDELTYAWDFGDGATSTEANPAHTFTERGAYTVDLTVSDGENTSSAVPIVIQVGQPPEVTIATPAANSTYVAGQEITYNAFATDQAGFDLNDADIKTDVIFHHDTHTHPFIDDQIGRAGSFVIPDTGEAAANTWYEISVTASDGAGVSTTESINIYPETTTMTYATQPAGLKIALDGVPHTAPHTVEQVVNFRRELSAPATQVGVDGNVYQFKEWSDGGAVRHFVAAPSVDTTITAIYEPAGAFTGEYFDNQNLEGEPVVTRQDPVIDFVWFDGSPAPGVPADQFSARWTKNQYFAAGRYKFTTATDDGVRLYIDGNLVIDKWQDQGTTAWTHTLNLGEGNHTIRMEYFDSYVSATAKLSWEATQDQTVPTPDGWRGEYFNNATLTGEPALLRGDQTIDFDWAAGSPDPAVNADDFSTRWTTTKTFETATYRFSATSDDGIRVYLGDELIIDEWTDHGAETFTVEKDITAGPHDLKVEYYERFGDATAKVNITKVTTEEPIPEPGIYTAQYFDNKTLAGEPAVTREETAIDHDWKLGSPDPAVPTEEFSARWTKTETFAGGNYTFNAIADDGVRVYVDNQLIIDKWVDQSSPTHMAKVDIAPGEHEIKMEYYENYVDAAAKLSYTKTVTEPIPNDEQWHIYYYKGKGFDGEPLEHAHSDELDFDWAEGAPFEGGPTDDFSATFTKTDTFDAGTYRFNITADDGVRVYVDGKVVYDQWVDQSATLKSFDVAMSAGQHDIKMEYYEGYVDAIAKLNYAPAETSGGTSSGYFAEFFAGKDLAGAPLFTRFDTAIDFDWGEGAPFEGGPINDFSVRWTKTHTFIAGTYSFTATSDDGIRVYIDGVPVIDQWTDHSAATFETTIDLTAGNHDIVVEYYEGYVDAAAKVVIAKS